MLRAFWYRSGGRVYLMAGRADPLSERAVSSG